LESGLTGTILANFLDEEQPIGGIFRECQLTDANSSAEGIVAELFQECSRFAFPKRGVSQSVAALKTSDARFHCSVLCFVVPCLLGGRTNQLMMPLCVPENLP
jgi:hypothetical protein